MSKVFICGKMTGDPYYLGKFFRYARRLDEMGYEPVNPALLPETIGREAALLITIPMLAACDAICLIPDWVDSPGAKAEKAFAEAIDMGVIECTI